MKRGGTLQSDETQASQMKNDAVYTSFCAIKNTYKATALRDTFPSVWGTAAMVTKMVWKRGQ